MKNLTLLSLLVFVTFAFAKEPIEKESMEEAENFKVEKAVKEKSAGRAFAGGKAKKDSPEGDQYKEETPTTEDSEVRFWKYSE
jgi:hypothetical protein